jgi:hypothetical protein
MAQRIVHSRGIVVCEERYLRTMWELQAAADAGRTGAEGFGGFADHVIPMEPMDEEKFARCEYCYDCHVAVIARDGLIPPD